MKDIYVTINISNYYAKKILKIDEYNNEIFNNEMFGIKDYDCPMIDVYDEEDYYTLTLYEDGLDFAGKVALEVMKYTKGKAHCTSGYDENNPKYKYTYKNDLVLVEGYTEGEINSKNNKLRNKFNEISNYLDDYIILSDDEDCENKLNKFFEDYNTDIEVMDKIKEFIDDQNLITLEWVFLEDYLQILRLAKKKFVLKESKPLVFANEYIEDRTPNEGFFSNLFNIFKTNKNDSTKGLSWKEREFEKKAKLWGLTKEDKRIAKQERMSPADFVEAEERDNDDLFTDEW